MTRSLAGAAIAVLAAIASAGAEPTPTTTVVTDLGFRDLLDKVRDTVKANDMLVVYSACASCVAANRGVEIPGNAVVGVYRNDFAVRMLEASVPAGIEAPIELMVIGNDDGTASLVYQLPSDVFRPYGNADLDAMAAELDAIWLTIVEQATGA